MSNAKAQSDDLNERLRSLPAVHELAARLDASLVGLEVAANIARETIDAARLAIREGVRSAGDLDSLVAVAQAAILREARPPLRPAINATGIIIHTGLGRSPMSERAVDAIREVARAGTPVELDMQSGQRGKRTGLVRGLLCEMTGAESATVVNNCAAALLVTLATLARDRRVIVSRSELVEIGGSFRLPEVIEGGGAHLREVGTTNRVRIDDFERAINDETGAILRVHASNFRIEGFACEVDLADLATLARRYELPMIHDIGSGLLSPSDLEILKGEPDARTSIGAGVDLVLFSGDKLLGGPQAGIIVGRADLIDRIEKSPLMRALRVDKLTLAGLAVTLQQHRDRGLAMRELPVLRAIARSVEELTARGETLCSRLNEIEGIASARVIETKAYVGGGSNPAQAIESVGVAIRCESIGEDEFSRRLRTGEPGVFGRIERGEVVLDVRTIDPSQDDGILLAIDRAAGGVV